MATDRPLFSSRQGLPPLPLPPHGRLVLRFRSSHHFAAPSRANFGSGALARISHTRCGLRRFKKPTGQEPRAARCGTSGKRGDAACRLLQPALWVAFRRASPASGGSTVCPDTLFAARRCICLAERATQAAWSVRNAG